MTTTLPRPSRPSLNAAAIAPLPALSISKTRQSSASPSGLPTSTRLSYLPSTAALQAPATIGQQNTTSKVLHAYSTSNIPTVNDSSEPLEVAAAGSKLRKVISIDSFPQPPSGTLGSSSIPARPATPSTTQALHAVLSQEHFGTTSAEQGNRKFPIAGRPRTPSSLATARLRHSGPHLSLPSPPQSRSSSAQGLFSSSDVLETPFEEGNGFPHARESFASDGSSKGKDDKGNVIVSVRVRPDVGSSGGRDAEGEWMMDGRRSLISYRGREGGHYYYDNVFTTHDNNARVYDSAAKRLVRRVMEGYCGTVFAYGMTGTGKTFSMQGTATSPGVIPLAIADIFSFIRETPHREFLLRVSYLEIYNEKIYDLLSGQSVAGPAVGGTPQQEEIKLREDSKGKVYATPLKEEIVQSPTQLLRVIARGDHVRRTGTTLYNVRSSRSHAVVQIVVESRERMLDSATLKESKRMPLGPAGVRVSTLSLIDLAGSERAAEDKERRTEGAHINKSLLTLGTVVAKLSGDKDKQSNSTDKEGKHLPYRDSKLTRLLQPALCGDSLISILCTIQLGPKGSTAGLLHIGETLNTLKFAARARNNIVSHAKKAEEGFATGEAGSRALLDRYRLEILDLRKQLEEQAKQQTKVQVRANDEEQERARELEAEHRHEEQLLEMQIARTALKERIEHLNRLVLSSKSLGVNSTRSFSSMSIPPRASMHSTAESIRRSARSSTSETTADGIFTNRTDSISSATALGSIALSPKLGIAEAGSEEDDSLGDNGDGTASSKAQMRALRTDLADKNRYIAALEKRLLQQARRSSQSLPSSLSEQPESSSAPPPDPSSLPLQLREKDAEIATLRAQLDDRDRALAELRTTASRSKRQPKAIVAIDVAAAASHEPPGAAPTTGTAKRSAQAAHHHHHHRRRESSNASSTTSSHNVKAVPLSPLSLLSSVSGEAKAQSIDDMSRLLDEVIQDRVLSGGRVGLGTGTGTASLRLRERRRREVVQGSV